MEVVIVSNEDFTKAAALGENLFDALDEGRFSPATKKTDGLSIIDPHSGCDFTADFMELGSNDRFIWSDFHNAYLTTKYDYEWWANVIGKHKKMYDKIAELEAEHGVDLVQEIVHNAIASARLNDLGLASEAKAVMSALDAEFANGEAPASAF